MIFTGNINGNDIYILNDFYDHTCNWGGMAAILIFRQILNSVPNWARKLIFFANESLYMSYLGQMIVRNPYFSKFCSNMRLSVLQNGLLSNYPRNIYFFQKSFLTVNWYILKILYIIFHTKMCSRWDMTFIFGFLA